MRMALRSGWRLAIDMATAQGPLFISQQNGAFRKPERSDMEDYAFDPNQLEWSDPPAEHWRTGGGQPRVRKYQELVDYLAEHPRAWVIFRKDAKTGQGQDLQNYPELQVKRSPNGDGTSTVRVRYVGLDENGEPDLDPEDKAARERRKAAAQKRAATRKANQEAAAGEAA